MAEARTHAPGNASGLAEALLGLVGGFFISVIAVTAYVDSRGHHASTTSYGADITSLVGLWVGLVGAAVLASRMAGDRGTGSLRSDFGLAIRPLVDVPLGIAVGVAAQYALVPVMEAPLRPFVHHLSQRLGHPTNQLLGHVNGPGLVALAILICLGSPLVEELFFRGLLLRALLGRLAPLGRRLAPAISIAVTGIIFGLVHFEALQFLGLAGFGVVLGVLAWWTGRLGPSVIAHIAFNTTTVVAFALSH